MNRYGLDTSYFEDLIKREFGDLSNYTPSEFARVCARMAASADSSVFDEPEFHPSTRCDHIPTPFGTPAIWRCHKCGLKMDEPELAEKVERLTMVIGGRMCGKTSSQKAMNRLATASAAVGSVLAKAVLAMESVQVENNDDFIQRKMQGKRRIY